MNLMVLAHVCDMYGHTALPGPDYAVQDITRKVTHEVTRTINYMSEVRNIWANTNSAYVRHRMVHRIAELLGESNTTDTTGTARWLESFMYTSIVRSPYREFLGHYYCVFINNEPALRNCMARIIPVARTAGPAGCGAVSPAHIYHVQPCSKMSARLF